MYRAIIASTREVPSRSFKQLRKELVTQFRFSPLCEKVLVEKDRVVLDDDLKNLTSDKVEIFTDLSELKLENTKSIGIIPSTLGSNIGVLGQLDSIILIKSIYTKEIDPCEAETIAKLRVRNPELRASVFAIGRIIQDLPADESLMSLPMSKMEIVQDNLYPIYSQFLPARFREISPRNLAQAIRLNYETCEISNHADGIEKLNYVDCMKIIGLDDRI